MSKIHSALGQAVGDLHVAEYPEVIGRVGRRRNGMSFREMRRRINSHLRKKGLACQRYNLKGRIVTPRMPARECETVKKKKSHAK